MMSMVRMRRETIMGAVSTQSPLFDLSLVANRRRGLKRKDGDFSLGFIE